jgi:hypothetical protein
MYFKIILYKYVYPQRIKSSHTVYIHMIYLVTHDTKLEKSL